MKKIFDYIKKEKIGIIITIVITIVITYIFGYYFLIKGQQKIDLCYSLNTFPIANSDIEYVNFNGKKYNNISVTNVTITNKGNKALNGKSMLNKAPLQIVINKNFEIINAYKQNRKTTNNIDYSLILDKNNIIMPFEVINPKSQITFSIIHTGYSNDDIYLKGEWENFNGISRDNPTKKSVLIIVVLSALLLIITVYSITSYIKNKDYLNWIEKQLNCIVEGDPKLIETEYKG